MMRQVEQKGQGEGQGGCGSKTPSPWVVQGQEEGSTLESVWEEPMNIIFDLAQRHVSASGIAVVHMCRVSDRVSGRKS